MLAPTHCWVNMRDVRSVAFVVQQPETTRPMKIEKAAEVKQTSRHPML